MTFNTVCNLIFVYGTLRNDPLHELFHLLAHDAEFIGEGYVNGCLFNLGDYPGMVLSVNSSEQVKGELYKISQIKLNTALDILDQFEGCGHFASQPCEYRRELVNVFITTDKSITAWAYVLNKSTEGLQPIDSGDYLSWRASRGHK
jgi:gamma-glutamylcyclotransferase (GGCT)/AIG2-like uncharacterized protein YtfP